MKPPTPDQRPHRTTRGGVRFIILYIMDIMDHTIGGQGGGLGGAVNADAYKGLLGGYHDDTSGAAEPFEGFTLCAWDLGCK